MRTFINIINNHSTPTLLEKSRGILYRSKGDKFIQGSPKDPTDEMFFDHVDYFPGQPGEFADATEMANELKALPSVYPGLIPVNKQTPNSRAFAIITLKKKDGSSMYVLRFFQKIMQDMQGLWKNNELPGNWQLTKKSSLKASYGLKPTDLLTINKTYTNPLEIINELSKNAKMVDLIHGLQMLLGKKKPIFEQQGDMISALQDDLGEIMAPIALVMGMINDEGANAAKNLLFPNGTWTRGNIRFPDGKTNGLVDSYITVDGVEVGISSKGKVGAKASIKNVFDGIAIAKASVSDSHKRKLVEYAKQVELVTKIGTSNSIDYPLQYAVDNNLITQNNAKYIKELINVGAKTFNELNIPLTEVVALEKIKNRFNAKTTLSNYCIGYHILAAIAREVTVHINQDEKFGQMCLYFVNVNPIVQVHLDMDKIGEDAKVTKFEAKFPPNFQGTILLESSKNYSATGVSGRFTFGFLPDKENAKQQIEAEKQITLSQLQMDKKIEDIGMGKAISNVKLAGSYEEKNNEKSTSSARETR